MDSAGNVSKIIRNKERRAVAPIIATLLMVAISVVGGILVFVFAQGFFTSTSVQGPTIESIDIFGFDARDAGNVGFPKCLADTSLAAHNGNCITAVTVAPGANANKLRAGDAIVIYVRNTSAVPTIISTVEFAGKVAEFDGAVTAISATVPAQGKFTLATTPTTSDVSVNGAGGSAISPGEEKTLVLRYGGTNLDVGDIKLGRTILVKIITSNGSTFPITVQNGVNRGT